VYTFSNRCLVLVLSVHLSVCLCMCVCVCANAVECLVFVCGFISVSFFLVVGARKHATHTQPLAHTHTHIHTYTHTFHFCVVSFVAGSNHRQKDACEHIQHTFKKSSPTHWMSHVTHVNKSRVTRWIRHVTHMIESCHTINESCHTHERVMSIHLNESCRTHGRDMSRSRRTQVSQMKESCHADPWVTSHTWTNHVTHMSGNES